MNGPGRRTWFRRRAPLRGGFGSGLAAAALLLFGCARPATVRERLRLDPGWTFHLGDVPGAQAPAFDDRDWRRVDLPHDWSIESPPSRDAPSGPGGGFFPGGIGWYRRRLDVPHGWTGRRVEVEFEGVYQDAEVWINGEQVGRHPYGFTPFRCDLSPWLKPGDGNVLAVRVDNSQQPNCRWYAGSGIYRHVWLEVTEPVRIAPEGAFFRTLAATSERALVRVEVEVQNPSRDSQQAEVTLDLVDPAGTSAGRAVAKVSVAAGASATATADVPVLHPALWSLQTPQLYHAAVRLRAGRRYLDALTVPFGIRTLAVSAGRGLEINGRSVKLDGADVHADDGVLGAAAFDRAEERRVRLLKEAGFNAVRTAHNPPSPAFLEACDRLGLLVMDEAFDGWAKGKNRYDYSLHFNQWWRRDLDAMVRRDRNHPSVILWSIGNEVVERTGPEGARIAAMLAGRVRELDPSRPVTAGINGLGPHGDWTRLDPLFAALGVAGYNYEIDRSAADHARVPSRVIVETESEPIRAFPAASAVGRAPYVIGDFVWSGMDYLGEAAIGRVFPPGQPAVPHWKYNPWPWHGAVCGDIDLTGWRRPISHYRNIVWGRGETLYLDVRVPAPGGGSWNLSQWAVPPALPSWTWPGQEGKPLTVEVDSRWEAVRLYLNDRLVGEQPTGRAQEYRALFTVPYAPGALRAAGLRQGREVESLALRTAGPPAALRLSVDRPTLRADGEDLAFITVQVVDRDGVPEPEAAPSVRLDLAGPGLLAGYGSADMTSLESYQANPHRLFQGRALAVVRAERTPGSIRVRASADGLEPAELSLESLP